MIGKFEKKCSFWDINLSKFLKKLQIFHDNFPITALVYYLTCMRPLCVHIQQEAATKLLLPPALAFILGIKKILV